jgi:2-amino-4-hydroxy-6-hydroxymethyldihydropteridine diphosphokinase
VSRAVLSLGSNIGDRAANLRGALATLRAAGARIVAVSPVYATAPWGGVEQDEFLNAVVVVEDPASRPRDWLARARAAESRAGRTRDVRWGPRTLDVDVIDVDGHTSDDPVLTLPHPRAHERAFVLVPWLDVDPEARITGRGRAADLLAALPAEERDGVRRDATELEGPR